MKLKCHLNAWTEGYEWDITRTWFVCDRTMRPAILRRYNSPLYPPPFRANAVIWAINPHIATTWHSRIYVEPNRYTPSLGPTALRNQRFQFEWSLGNSLIQEQKVWSNRRFRFKWCIYIALCRGSVLQKSPVWRRYRTWLLYITRGYRSFLIRRFWTLLHMRCGSQKQASRFLLVVWSPENFLLLAM